MMRDEPQFLSRIRRIETDVLQDRLDRAVRRCARLRVEAADYQRSTAGYKLDYLEAMALAKLEGRRRIPDI